MLPGDSAAHVSAPPAKGLFFKLSVMMFLQFFIWGAWFEVNFAYLPSLEFNQTWQQPLVFGAFNLGSLVALFVGTQFVDRHYSAERFLSFSHLVGGLAILGLFFIHKGEPGAAGTARDLSFWLFF